MSHKNHFCFLKEPFSEPILKEQFFIAWATFFPYKRTFCGMEW